MTEKRDDNGGEKSKQPPRRRGGLVSFGADVRRLVSPILGKKGFIQADILAHWEEIIGAELATGVRPAAVSFSKSTPDQAVLTVSAYSGAFAVAFSARKAQILERINTYFGYPALADIKIKQGGFTPKLPKSRALPPLSAEKRAEIDALTAGIADDALRETLNGLGALIESSKK